MKTNEILEGNRILAEFMGHNCDIGAAIRFMYSYSEPFPLSGNDVNFESVESEVQMEVEEFGSTLEIKTVSFHNSWDWLMSVVEKIAEIHKDIQAYAAAFENNDLEDLLNLENKNCSSFVFWSDELRVSPNIKDTFCDCVWFVQWYNESCEH